MENQTITCGCGFSVTGPDPEWNAAAHEDHNCPNVSVQTESTLNVLLGHLFSLWGVIVVATIGAAIVAAVNHTSF